MAYETYCVSLSGFPCVPVPLGCVFEKKNDDTGGVSRDFIADRADSGYGGDQFDGRLRVNNVSYVVDPVVIRGNRTQETATVCA